MYRIEFSDDSKLDVLSYRNYLYVKEGPERASKRRDVFFDKIESLERFPFMNPVKRNIGGKEIRMFVTEEFEVHYVVHENKKIVEILRVFVKRQKR